MVSLAKNKRFFSFFDVPRVKVSGQKTLMVFTAFLLAVRERKAKVEGYNQKEEHKIWPNLLIFIDILQLHILADFFFEIAVALNNINLLGLIERSTNFQIIMIKIGTKIVLLLLLQKFSKILSHVTLTFPPARTYGVDYLDNYRFYNQEPCGMPKTKG